MTTKRMRITGVGTFGIKYPGTYKGMKVTPSLYKVRTGANGHPVATIALYYQKNGKRTFWKNQLEKFKPAQ